jgi:Gamma-glutamyl cyclotransferase, AIG2-like
MMAPTTHVVATGGAKIFVYGTLMAEQVVTTLIGRMPSYTKARVLGFRRHPVRDVVYPAVIPVAITREDHDDVGAAAAVEGLLLQDLAPGEMQRLDWYEGTDYKRVAVLVELLQPNNNDDNATTKAEPSEAAAAVTAAAAVSTTTTTTSAFMYQWDSPLDQLDIDRPWDYEAFLRNHLPEYISAAALPARHRMESLFPKEAI